MNTPTLTLLLCTNGAPVGLPALDYGVWLAGVLHLPVTLLGIVESPSQDTLVQEALQAAQMQLEAKHIPFAVQIRSGRARDVICAEAIPEQHLVIIGPMGRPKWRHWLQGSAFRRMMPNLQAPFIYTPAAHCQLNRILVSTGALEHAISAECWALFLAKRTGAALSILHVAETAHYQYPTAEKMETHWKDLLSTDIPQARHLRSLLTQAQAQGVEADLHVHHGAVVHEIIAESRRGQYDLVVMGSKYSSHSLRSQYLPDVAAAVMETLKTPVFIVRAGQNCPLAEQPPEVAVDNPQDSFPASTDQE